MTDDRRTDRLSDLEYAQLVARIHATVSGAVSPGSSVLFVSKGDPALLEQPSLSTGHFPQSDTGAYAGHHPHDSAEATMQLERLRRAGAEYLVIPATARWWLDFYGGFAEHLADHGDVLVDSDSCLIYGLGRVALDATAAPAIERPRASVDQIRDYLEHLLSIESSVIVLEGTNPVSVGLAPLRATGLALQEPHAEDGRLFAELSRRAVEGADYLVVPRSVDGLLDCHEELAHSIEACCRKIADQGHLCRVFELVGLREPA
jgi:hypothetical protein